jgi:hypothetical protein
LKYVLEGTSVKLLTYGHLTAAIYKAAEEQPTNPNVLLIKEHGISGCVAFKSNTPFDVLRWIIQSDNQYHAGASYSYMELFAVWSLITLSAAVVNYVDKTG